MNQTAELLISQLPAEEQALAQKLHLAFTNITGPLEDAWRAVVAETGMGFGTVRGRYYQWKADGIAGLVNAAKNPQFRALRTGGIQPETLREYHHRCLNNGRKCKPAYRELTKDFFDGKAIPGVGPDRSRLPAGWSYATFQRHAPTQFEMAAARVSRREAAQFRPLVFTTRKNLRVGQYVMMDEMWHNFEVVVLGRRQRCRLLQLHAHDVFSACQFARAIKPRIQREDETRANISLSDVVFLLGYIFAKFGVPAEGMCFVIESGTATVPEEIRELITRLTSGAVTWRLGECKGERSFMGQYLGRSKGDFKLKASLESSHNLIQNEAANLRLFPGQTGSNSRINLPDELHGRQRHEDKLLLALSALPEPVRERLRHPFPVSTDAIRAIEHLCETINWRGALPWWREHEIEGFEEAGLVTIDYHFSNGAICSGSDFLAKSDVEQAAIAAAATPVARKLAPAEVFYPAAKSWTRWRPHQLAQLFWHARYDQPKRIGNNHLLEIDDEDASPATLRFEAHHLSPGDEYFCTVNALLPNLCFLYDLKGGFIGCLKHWQTVPREDVAEWEKQAGRAAQIENQLLAPVRAAGLELTRKEAADHAHNAAVLDEAAEAQDEKKRNARAAMMSVD